MGIGYIHIANRIAEKTNNTSKNICNGGTKLVEGQVQLQAISAGSHRGQLRGWVSSGGQLRAEAVPAA